MADKTLAATVGSAFVVVATSAYFFYERGVALLPKESVAVGLTNLATIGGIVSGLSLSGTAVLSLSGRYVEKLQERYGTSIRLVLFGGFSLIVTTSLACAMAAMWSGEAWARWLLAAGAPAVLVVLIATALLINSAFAWKEHGDKNPLTPDPYRNPQN